MKSTYIFLFIIFVLLGICFLGATELLKETKLKQAEINGLKKEIQEQADSLTTVLKQKEDSLQIALHTIDLQSDTIKITIAEKEKYKSETHDKIHFIQFANDARRDSVLTNLYPSFRSF